MGESKMEMGGATPEKKVKTFSNGLTYQEALEKLGGKGHIYIGDGNDGVHYWLNQDESIKREVVETGRGTVETETLEKE